MVLYVRTWMHQLAQQPVAAHTCSSSSRGRGTINPPIHEITTVLSNVCKMCCDCLAYILAYMPAAHGAGAVQGMEDMEGLVASTYGWHVLFSTVNCAHLLWADACACIVVVTIMLLHVRGCAPL
jgi:hypothetical protein